MQNPVRLRIKPVEVDAMPYTGDNVEALMEWVRQNDPSLLAYSVHRDYPTVGLVRSDGSCTRIAPIEYLSIESEAREFRLYKGQWILKSSNGLLSVHSSVEIATRYERVL